MRFAGVPTVRETRQTYDVSESGLARSARRNPARARCTGLRARGMAMEIADWRLRIDELDEQIVKLLCERAACAIEIGKIKRGSAAPIYEPRREQQVYDHVRSANPGPLKGVQIQDIYERIMDVMRALQKTSEGQKPGASEGERWRPPATPAT